MSVGVRVIDGPLPPRRHRPSAEGVGAVLVFEGVVRPGEDGGVVEALDYQAYEPMASMMLEEIAGALVREHGLTAIMVEHSRGRIGVGECSFRLTIESPHRKEALRAADEFIDRLKRDVPIWKRPVWRTPPPPPITAPS